MENQSNILMMDKFKIYIDETKEQLVRDGGVVMGECLLNVIDETLYEYLSKNNILVLPDDFSTLSWTIFKEIEADSRITITED